MNPEYDFQAIRDDVKIWAEFVEQGMFSKNVFLKEYLREWNQLETINLWHDDVKMVPSADGQNFDVYFKPTKPIEYVNLTIRYDFDVKVEETKQEEIIW